MAFALSVVLVVFESECASGSGQQKTLREGTGSWAHTESPRMRLVDNDDFGGCHHWLQVWWVGVPTSTACFLLKLVRSPEG